MNSIQIYDTESIKDNYEIEITNLKFVDNNLNADVNIDDYKFNFQIGISREHIEDIKFYGYSLDDDYMINILKLEALSYYMNNNKLIRRRKLEKINQIYENI